MSYKEEKKTITTRGNEKVGDWDLNYIYESEDNKKPDQFTVNGTNKTGGSLNVTYNGFNKNISFGGGAEWDADLAKSVIDQIQKLSKSFD